MDFKRKTAFVLAVGLLLGSFGVLADNRETGSITRLVPVDGFVNTEATEYGETYSISEINMSRYRATLEKTHVDSARQNREVLLSVGFSESDLEMMGQEEINLIVDEAAGISVSTEYYKVDDNGELILMKKEDCLREAEAVRQEEWDRILNDSVTPLSSTTNNNVNVSTSSDGYMKITTSATYISPGSASGAKGWYYMQGAFEWLTMPGDRKIDAVSLYAQDCAWSVNDGDYYSTFYHTAETATGGIHEFTTQKTSSQGEMKPEGIFFTWQLPISTYVASPTGATFIVRSMKAYIRGKARVREYSSSRSFNLFSKYEHLKTSVSVNTDFTWSTSGWPGVSVTANLSNKCISYYAACLVDYNPNRGIYK